MNSNETLAHLPKWLYVLGAAITPFIHGQPTRQSILSRFLLALPRPIKWGRAGGTWAEMWAQSPGKVRPYIAPPVGIGRYSIISRAAVTGRGSAEIWLNPEAWTRGLDFIFLMDYDFVSSCITYTYV